MFYTTLKEYNRLIETNLGELRTTEDLIRLLRTVPGTTVNYATVDINVGVTDARFRVSNEHGTVELNYRFNRQYVLMLLSSIVVDGRVALLRWWDEPDKFRYPVEEHRDTVYSFMKNVLGYIQC